MHKLKFQEYAFLCIVYSVEYCIQAKSKPSSIIVFHGQWIIIIIWFGDTVTMSHLTKCNTNSKVQVLYLSHVNLTDYPIPFLKVALHLTQPHPQFHMLFGMSGHPQAVRRKHGHRLNAMSWTTSDEFDIIPTITSSMMNKSHPTKLVQHGTNYIFIIPFFLISSGIYIYKYVYVHVYIQLYMYMYMYMYMWVRMAGYNRNQRWNHKMLVFAQKPKPKFNQALIQSNSHLSHYTTSNFD